MPSLPTSWHGLLVLLTGWPRRIAAVLCLLLALATATTRSHSPTLATEPTVTASRPLTAGTVVSAADLVVTAWPTRAAPEGAARTASSIIGRRLATNLARGMPITRTDLLEPAIAAALADGLAATTVDLTDARQLTLLHTGDHVDLYPNTEASQFAESPADSAGSPIARDARVLSILPASDTAPDAKPALVVATDRTAAAQLAGRMPAAFVATLVQPP